MSEKSQVAEQLQPEIQQIQNKVDAIIKPEFSCPENSLKPQDKREPIARQQARERYVMTSTGKEPVALVDFLDQNLAQLAKVLPDAKKQELIQKGVLTEKGGQLLFTDKISPFQKLDFVAELRDQVDKEGMDKLSVALAEYDINANDALTCLQALAIDYGEQAIAPYLKPTEVTTEVIGTRREIKRKWHGVHQISGAFTPKEDELHLSLMRGSIFRVDRAIRAKDSQNQETGFAQLESEMSKAVRAGQANGFSSIAERFMDISKNDPATQERIVSSLKRTIARKLSDQNIPDEEKMKLAALTGTDLKDLKNFKDAMRTLFPFEKWQKELADPKKQAESKRNLYSGFYEWGQVIFGSEGMERLKEVDLRMAVAMQDVLLPPEIRQRRITLQNKIDEQRQKHLTKLNGADEKTTDILRTLQSFDTDLQDLQRQLELHRQTERKAILHAFGVKYEDGGSAVEEKDLDDATKKLAEQIRQRHSSVVREPVMKLNRDMAVQGIKDQGVNLTTEQEAVLNRYLTYGGSKGEVEVSGDKVIPTGEADEILAKLGVTKDNPKYALIKTHLLDGRRTTIALGRLGKQQTDVYSKVEDLRLGGTLFDMGLKGVDYLYRHGEFEEVKKQDSIKIIEKTEPPKVKLPDQVPTYRIDEAGDGLFGLLTELEIPEAKPEKIVVEVYPGKREKMDVFNNGRGGKEWAVPFQIRRGQQLDTLVLSMDPKDQNGERVIELEHIDKAKKDLDLILRQDKGGRLLANEDVVDLSKGPQEFTLTEKVKIVVVGFDPDKREVIIYKKVGDKVVEFKLPAPKATAETPVSRPGSRPAAPAAQPLAAESVETKLSPAAEKVLKHELTARKLFPDTNQDPFTPVAELYLELNSGRETARNTHELARVTAERMLVSYLGDDLIRKGSDYRELSDAIKFALKEDQNRKIIDELAQQLEESFSSISLPVEPVPPITPVEPASPTTPEKPAIIQNYVSNQLMLQEGWQRVGTEGKTSRSAGGVFEKDGIQLRVTREFVNQDRQSTSLVEIKNPGWPDTVKVSVSLMPDDFIKVKGRDLLKLTPPIADFFASLGYPADKIRIESIHITDTDYSGPVPAFPVTVTPPSPTAGVVPVTEAPAATVVTPTAAEAPPVAPVEETPTVVPTSVVALAGEVETRQDDDNQLSPWLRKKFVESTSPTAPAALGQQPEVSISEQPAAPAGEVLKPIVEMTLDELRVNADTFTIAQLQEARTQLDDVPYFLITDEADRARAKELDRLIAEAQRATIPAFPTTHIAHEEPRGSAVQAPAVTPTVATTPAAQTTPSPTEPKPAEPAHVPAQAVEPTGEAPAVVERATTVVQQPTTQPAPAHPIAPETPPMKPVTQMTAAELAATTQEFALHELTEARKALGDIPAFLIKDPETKAKAQELDRRISEVRRKAMEETLAELPLEPVAEPVPVEPVTPVAETPAPVVTEPVPPTVTAAAVTPTATSVKAAQATASNISFRDSAREDLGRAYTTAKATAEAAAKRGRETVTRAAANLKQAFKTTETPTVVETPAEIAAPVVTRPAAPAVPEAEATTTQEFTPDAVGLDAFIDDGIKQELEQIRAVTIKKGPSKNKSFYYSYKIVGSESVGYDAGINLFPLRITNDARVTMSGPNEDLITLVDQSQLEIEPEHTKNAGVIVATDQAHVLVRNNNGFVHLKSNASGHIIYNWSSEIPHFTATTTVGNQASACIDHTVYTHPITLDGPSSSVFFRSDAQSTDKTIRYINEARENQVYTLSEHFCTQYPYYFLNSYTFSSHRTLTGGYQIQRVDQRNFVFVEALNTAGDRALAVYEVIKDKRKATEQLRLEFIDGMPISSANELKQRLLAKTGIGFKLPASETNKGIRATKGVASIIGKLFRRGQSSPPPPPNSGQIG